MCIFNLSAKAVKTSFSDLTLGLTIRRQQLFFFLISWFLTIQHCSETQSSLYAY